MSTETAPDASPEVINSASRFGLQRTVQLLGDAGVFVDDDARGAILVAKRVNHALFGDFSKEGLSVELLGRITTMQETYRKAVQETPYAELVASGKLNNLLVDYINILLDRSRENLSRLQIGKLEGQDEKNPASLDQLIDKEEKKIHGLMGELNTYTNGADYTKQTLLRVENLVKLNGYMPLGKLVIGSGLIKNASPEVATDLVNDVLGTAAARGIAVMAKRLDCVEAVDATRCQRVAFAERQLTNSLDAVFGFEAENPRLDRIVALRTLLSAQLNHAFSEEGLTPPQQAALEKAAQALTKEYAQVAMSLAWHYLNEGPAVNDARVVKMRENFKKEMEQSGITFIAGEEDAINKAKILARNSAQDLLVPFEQDAAKKAMIKTLAKAVGCDAALSPKSELIAIVANNPADYKVIVGQDLLSHAAKEAEKALRKTSYDHALGSAV